MSLTPAIDGYFAEASAWDRDRVESARRSIRLAWRVAAAGWICAITSAAALIALMPLKRVEPFVVRVDRSTGVVDVVPVYAGRATESEVVTRYFLMRYVSLCQRFNFATAASDYQECGAFQTPAENQAWYARWSRSNPASPLNVHRDGSSVEVRVESISFLHPVGGPAHFAQVRYVRSTRAAAGTHERSAHFIATVRYAYGAPSADPRVRRFDPLGFKILNFQAEPEVLGEAAASVPAAAHGAGR